MFDAHKIRQDFPILRQNIAYLDNAATTQKPQVVIDALTRFYSEMNANVARGLYSLAEIATDKYEEARNACARLINSDSDEIVFVRNGTEAINLVAGSLEFGPGAAIVVSELEHHANFLPWVRAAERSGAEIRVLRITGDEGSLDLSRLNDVIDEKVKLVAITQVSNVLGVRPDLEKIIHQAHLVGAKVMVDAVQGIAHFGLDVGALKPDFAAFSGHKMFGPMGIGFLYGRREHLNKMPPFLVGGGMIKELENLQPKWREIPAKFEAGTPNAADAYALTSAIEYLDQFSYEDIVKHDFTLGAALRERFAKYDRVRLLGPEETGIVSFTVDGVHSHDIASIFATEGVCIRAGHHCAKPLMQALDLNSTSRLSFHIYNTLQDVERAEKALQKVLNIFK